MFVIQIDQSAAQIHCCLSIDPVVLHDMTMIFKAVKHDLLVHIFEQ